MRNLMPVQLGSSSEQRDKDAQHANADRSLSISPTYLGRPEPGRAMSHNGAARHTVTPPVERDPDSDSLKNGQNRGHAKIRRRPCSYHIHRWAVGGK